MIIIRLTTCYENRMIDAEVSNIVSLFFFLGIAVWQDIRTRTISNLLILAGFFTGLVYRLSTGGWSVFMISLTEMIPVVILLFPLFLCRCLGAGDIKLLGVVAVYCSWKYALTAFALSLYLSLIPLLTKFLIIRIKNHSKQNLLGIQIPMSCPILGAVLILQCKEVFF